GRAVLLVRTYQRHFLADVFVEELRRLEQIVFIVLFDDAELIRLIQRTEMNRRGIHRGGDIHEFQAERTAGKREVADVANQGNVRVIDRHVEVGLIVEAGGLISGGTCSFLFLRSVNLVAARRRVQNGDGSEKGHRRSQPNPAKLCDIPGDFHHFLLDGNLRSLLERCGWNFLQVAELGERQSSRTRNGHPRDPAVAGLKALRGSSVPNRGVERIGGADSAEIFREGRLHYFPMRAAISSKKNGASAANDPAHLIGGGGAGEQVDKDAARLVRPGGATILGEFNQ